MHRVLLASILLVPAQLALGATSYQVEATLDHPERRAEGHLVIRWTNATAGPVSRIPMIFSGADGEGRVENVRVGAAPAAVDARTAKGFDLVPAEPVGSGETAVIELEFKSPPAQTDSSLPYVSFEEDWFPLAPSVRDGELEAELTELADFAVTLRFDAELEVACTGRILSESMEGGQRVYTTEAKGVVEYGFACHPDLDVLEADSAGVHIRSFFLPDDAKWGRRLLEYSVDIIAFYTERIGFYPQGVLDILPGYPHPWGGYPVTPNVVTIHRGLDEKGAGAEDFARWIMAHEIGHQYWGFGTVLDDPHHTRWFGLSMGIFTDRLYTRARGFGEDLHADFRWRYLGGVLASVDTTILQDIEQVKGVEWDWNNIVDHGKSFAVLEMLEYLVGEGPFLEIFREAHSRFRGQVVTLEKFRALCEEVSGRDLGWFFHQWYETPSVLDYCLGETRTWREGATFVTQATILRKGDAVMPLEIDLETVGGPPERLRVSGWTNKSTVTFRSTSAPNRVRLDPDGRLALLADASRRWRTVDVGARALLSLGRAGEAVELLEGLGGTAADQTYYWYLLGTSRLHAGDLAGADEALEHIETLKGRPGWERIHALGLLRRANLRDLQGRREEAEAMYRLCLDLDDTREEAAKCLKKPYERRP
jgi:hypothetical protein